MRVLILGAGYAGLRVALELDKLLTGRQDVMQVTLVERNLYHQHVALLHLAATMNVNLAEVAIPLDTILHRHAIRLHQGEVARIAPLQRQVVLADGLSLTYDRLVVATGVQTNYGTVPGAPQHTWPLRTYDEALRLRDHIVGCFRAASQTDDAEARRVLLTFAVVGGGFTGCQLAGELTDWCRKLCKETGISSREVRIALIERSGTLLKQFGTWASAEAASVLDQRGVSLHLNTTIERVEERRLILPNNRYIQAATIVWAGGVRAPQMFADSGLPTDTIGRVLVDRYLRVVDQAHIFAVGDCAHIPDPSGAGETVAATASYAIRQGEHLAASLLAEAQGDAPRMYDPLRLGYIVSLGPGEAVGDPLGVPTFGLPAFLLKQAIEKWYLTTL